MDWKSLGKERNILEKDCKFLTPSIVGDDLYMLWYAVTG